MITYLILILLLIITLTLTYQTCFLLKNAGGSLLYQQVSGLGALMILISGLSFTTIFKSKFDFVNLDYNFSLYSMVLSILLTYNLFKIWEIRHNQIAKTKYKSVMIILTLVNLLLLVFKIQPFFTGIDKKIVNNLPSVINVVLLTNTSLLFLRFNKLSSSIEFRFFPILIFLLSLLNIFRVLYNLEIISQNIYYTSLLGESVTFLLLMYFCLNDFKKSFYYYKKI